ncbi:proton-coupled zinc antiporter SLC30A2-like [Menidia menidia]
MEPTGDSEEEPLIETYLEPLTWMSPPEEKCSRSEVGECVTGADGHRQPDRSCEEPRDLSEAESDARRAAKRKLLVACAVSLVFMAGEVIGGFAAGSLAIMTDAAHLLTDVGSILISVVSLSISSRPRSQTMTFGWHRAEILGMLLSIVSIWAVTAVLVWSAAQRMAGGDYDIDSRIMLVTSACAVGVNILMALILHQSGASHAHSHGGSGRRPQRETRPHGHGNASVRAAFIHVLGDLLQSVGVLLAAIIIHFRPEFKVADPICTFLFSVLVIGTTVPVTKDVFRILMEGAPRGVGYRAVRELLLSVGDVAAVDSLHVWSLNMHHSLLSAHISTGEEADPQAILREATERLRSEFGFSSITIQVERGAASAVR